MDVRVFFRTVGRLEKRKKNVAHHLFKIPHGLRLENIFRFFLFNLLGATCIRPCLDASLQLCTKAYTSVRWSVRNAFVAMHEIAARLTLVLLRFKNIQKLPAFSSVLGAFHI